MIENQLKIIFDNQPKIYKLFTKRIFINICFGLLLFFIFLGLSLLIAGLAVKNNAMSPLIWTGLAIFILIVILFYFFEFFRRRCKNNLRDFSNFKNLYEQPLIKNAQCEELKLIDTDKRALHIFMNNLSLHYKMASLGKQGYTFKTICHQTEWKITSAFYINYLKALQSDMGLQLLIKKTIKKDELPELVLFQSPIEDNQTGMKVISSDEGLNLLSNDNHVSLNDKRLKKIIELIKTYKQKGYELSCYVYEQEINFILISQNNELMIDFENIKLYKKSHEELFQQFDNNQILISELMNDITKIC